MEKISKLILQRVILFSLVLIMSVCQPFVYGTTANPVIDSNELYNIRLNSNGI